jgi:hypothetical protein
MLQFYKHGCWQRVLIDNYLPCIDGEDRLAFACSGHVGELWPSFMEKGYAKVRQFRVCGLRLMFACFGRNHVCREAGGGGVSMTCYRCWASAQASVMS